MSSPSPPTTALGELAVSEAGRPRPAQRTSMVTTRGQARAQGSVRGKSGRSYNLREISNEPERRWIRDTLSEDEAMTVMACEATQTVYRFHISGESTIEVHREPSANPTPRCQCGTGGNESACKHIFWLIDRIAEVPGALSAGESITLFEDGSSEPRLASMVDNSRVDGFGAVVAKHDWPLSGNVDADVQEHLENMLSVFEPNRHLPEEYRNYNWVGLSQGTRPYEHRLSKAYKDFGDMLVSDAFAGRSHLLTRRLEAILPESFQELIIFEKYRERAKQAFERLDMYSLGTEAPALDVHRCADTLRNVASLIHGKLSRLDKQEDTEEISYAVSPLVHILAEVVLRRDCDAYSNMIWHRAAEQADERDANLYARLVYDTGAEAFVLNVLLEGISPGAMAIAMDREPRVLSLMDAIARHIRGDAQAPREYTERAVVVVKRMRSLVD